MTMPGVHREPNAVVVGGMEAGTIINVSRSTENGVTARPLIGALFHQEVPP